MVEQFPGRISGRSVFQVVQEVTIAGEPEATRALLHEAWRRYLPNRLVGGVVRATDLRDRGMPVGAGPAAYVCTQDRCLEPATHPAELALRLEEAGAPRPPDPQ